MNLLLVKLLLFGQVACQAEKETEKVSAMYGGRVGLLDGLEA